MIHTYAIFQVCRFTVGIFYTVHYFFWLLLKKICIFNLFGIYFYIYTFVIVVIYKLIATIFIFRKLKKKKPHVECNQ